MLAVLDDVGLDDGQLKHLGSVRPSQGRKVAGKDLRAGWALVGQQLDRLVDPLRRDERTTRTRVSWLATGVAAAQDLRRFGWR
jgi:hypothetical protein